jgi:hypothetical protein
MKRECSQDELAALQQRLTRSQADLEQNQLGKNLVIVCLSVADPSIRRTSKFLGLPYPYPVSLTMCTDPDPDPSNNKQKT